jgi:hypothetical protein
VITTAELARAVAWDATPVAVRTAVARPTSSTGAAPTMRRCVPVEHAAIVPDTPSCSCSRSFGAAAGARTQVRPNTCATVRGT